MNDRQDVGARLSSDVGTTLSSLSSQHTPALELRSSFQDSMCGGYVNVSKTHSVKFMTRIKYL